MNSKFKKIMAYSLSTALIVTSCFTMGLSKKASQVKADETANTTSYEAVESFDFSSSAQVWSTPNGFKSNNLTQESTDESTTTGETETTTEEETTEDTNIATITKENSYTLNFADYNKNFIVGDRVTVEVTLDAESAYSAAIAGTLLNEGDVVGDKNWRSAATWWVTDSDENKTVTKTATFTTLSNSVSVQNWSTSDVAIKIKNIKVSVNGEEDFVKIPLNESGESTNYIFKPSDYNRNFRIGDKIKVTATLKSDKNFNGSMSQSIMLDDDKDYKWQSAASLGASFTKGVGYTNGYYEVTTIGVFKPKYDSVWLASWTKTNTNIRITDIKVEIVKEVKIDGERVENVVVGETYTLPEGDNAATYGYYYDGKMYKQGTKVTVNDEIDFTSVNTLDVTMTQGASIRYKDRAGLRFQSKITLNNMDAVDSDAITEGTLITTKDIYENRYDSKLDLKQGYSENELVNIPNTGWYKDTIGTYCGSICNITEVNYTREFVAVAYVTINYYGGESATYYSPEKDIVIRSLSGVASKVKEAGYVGIDEEYHSVINSFIVEK